MKNKTKIINMVKFSTLASITLLLGLVPQMGYLTFTSVVSITTVHIPVLIGAVVLPFVYVLALGLTFGLTSLIASFIYGKTPVDFAFQNPLISIVPRIIFAGLAFLVVLALRKLFKKIKHKQLTGNITIVILLLLFSFLISRTIISITGWRDLYVYLVAGLLVVFLSIAYALFINKEQNKKYSYIPTAFIISTIIHSIVVLSAIALLKPDAFGESSDIFGIILTSISFNGVIEALFSAIIGTPIVIALHQLEERTISNDFDVWCWQYRIKNCYC